MAKYALAPCNGMSANGLVCRVAVGDVRKQCSDVISICMGSTSADIEGANNEMLKKQPIIAINGCKNGCVNRILENKGIEVDVTVDAADVLGEAGVRAEDPFRLGEDGEECVDVIRRKLIDLISDDS